MSEEKKKISQLDEYGGSVSKLYTIGTKENAAGNPQSYKVPLAFLQTAADTANAAAASANTAAASASSSASAADAAKEAVEAGESSRQSAESARQAAETARAGAESSRAAAESSRSTAESSRASAETARVAAETRRESDCAAAAAGANSAADAANTAKAGAENAAATANAAAEAANTAAEGVFPALDANILRLVSGLDDFGDVKCRSLSSDGIPMVCGRPMILHGAGVPSASTVPDNWDAETMGEWTGAPTFTGQHYIDTSASSGGEYYAAGTSSVADWKNA